MSQVKKLTFLIVTNDLDKFSSCFFEQENRTEQRETLPLASIPIEVDGNWLNDMGVDKKHG